MEQQEENNEKENAENDQKITDEDYVIPVGDDKQNGEAKAPNKHPMAVYLVAISATLGGFLFGYDSGIINGALLLLDNTYSLSTLDKSLIVSSTVAAAALFALFSGITADIIGRRLTIMLAAAFFTIGAVCMGLAPSQLFIIIGRIIVGSSIGFVSAIVPVYVSECSPADIRGRLITLNQLFITLGIFVSAVIAAALMSMEETGWRLMLGLAALPGIIQFILFLTLPESPRYMMTKDSEKARTILQRLRGCENVEDELKDIQKTVEAEKDTKGVKIFKKLFTTSHTRKALFVGCMLQLFQQFCGINTVIYYSSTILLVAGFSESQAIWLTCIPFSVNFLATFIGLWAVETLGRRIILAVSFFAISLALVVLAMSFALEESHSAVADPLYEMQSLVDPCLESTTCHNCVRNPKCGFCYSVTDNGPEKGSCVSFAEKSKKYAQEGRCSEESLKMPSANVSASLRMTERCPSMGYAGLSVLGLILYVLFFAPGAGPMPWTINAEIYPMWCRGVAISLATVTNWVCNMIVSATFLTLIEVLAPVGTFLMFAVVCVVGSMFTLFMVPETKDKTLEEVEYLFMKPQKAQDRKVTMDSIGQERPSQQQKRASPVYTETFEDFSPDYEGPRPEVPDVPESNKSNRSNKSN